MLNSFYRGNPNWEELYLEYKRSVHWNRIYEFLRRDYWHATSESAWTKIQSEGFIRPSGDSKTIPRFAQTKPSFAFNRNCVSLFDFLTPSEQQAMRIWARAWDVMCEKSDTIILRIDRESLFDRVIPNSACWDAIEGGVTGFPPLSTIERRLDSQP